MAEARKNNLKSSIVSINNNYSYNNTSTKPNLESTTSGSVQMSYSYDNTPQDYSLDSTKTSIDSNKYSYDGSSTSNLGNQFTVDDTINNTGHNNDQSFIETSSFKSNNIVKKGLDELKNWYNWSIWDKPIEVVNKYESLLSNLGSKIKQSKKIPITIEEEKEIGNFELIENDRWGINIQYLPNGDEQWHNYNFTGDYLECYDSLGRFVDVPLAIASYENGKLVFTPMTESQKKIYTEAINNYFQEIEKSKDLYTDFFKDNLQLNSTVFVYYDQYSAPDYSGVHTAGSNIFINANDFVNVGDKLVYRDLSNSMVSAYTHELGHEFAKRLKYFDDSKEWKEIFNQVSSNEAYKEYIGEYAYSNDDELFAEATRYYYHYPDKLKMVDIDKDGYDNLYDYMDALMNGKITSK